MCVGVPMLEIEEICLDKSFIFVSNYSISLLEIVIYVDSPKGKTGLLFSFT